MITAMVKNAVGFDGDRSDQIEVVNMRFDNSDFQEEQQKLDDISSRSFYVDLGKKILLGLAVVFVFFYGKRKVRKAVETVAKYVPPLPPPPEPPKAPPAPPEPPIEIKPQKPRVVDQMRKTAAEKPDEMAKVIKTLMTE